MTTPQHSSTLSDFRHSITPDLFEVGLYIAWDEIETQLQEYAGAIDYLHRVVASAPMTTEALATGLRSEAHLFELACLLLALPQSPIGFVDGRELPENRHQPAVRISEIASLLMDLGFPRVIASGSNVRDLARVALAGQDAGKRRYRVGATITERLREVLNRAIAAASNEHNLLLAITPEPMWPPPAKGRVEYVLALGGRQSIAVASIFQTASGGRQQAELKVSYPNLQRDLADYGVNLLLVADGRGVRDARDSVLTALFAGVASCMTFRQAADGRLLRELLRLINTEPPKNKEL